MDQKKHYRPRDPVPNLLAKKSLKVGCGSIQFGSIRIWIRKRVKKINGNKTDSD